MTCGNGNVQKFRGLYQAALKRGKQCDGSNMENKTCHADCIGNVAVIHVCLAKSQVICSLETIQPAEDRTFINAGVEVSNSNN